MDLQLSIYVDVLSACSYVLQLDAPRSFSLFPDIVPRLVSLRGPMKYNLMPYHRLLARVSDEALCIRRRKSP